jgi:microcystin-dependent protein
MNNMSTLSAFLKRLRTPATPTTFTSPYTGQTYQYGKCYDAAGNLMEETLGSEPFIGEIMLFAGNFVPLNFLACDGSTLSNSQYSSLFALIGTTYGGSGSSFALPDLRGRIPIGAGTGQGLSVRVLGEKSGSETVALAPTNLPSITRVSSALIKNRAVGTVATGFETGRIDGTKAVNVTGAGQVYDNMPPYIGLQYCISMQGAFPSAT